jgi:hypothetical protein
VEVTEAWQYSQEMKAIIGKLVFLQPFYKHRTFLLIEKTFFASFSSGLPKICMLFLGKVDLKLTIINMCDFGRFPLVRKIIIYSRKLSYLTTQLQMIFG